ncbi:fungal-specific transcription factor domain-containing protein [Thelonectria olida]|uniref:Fungal-specific transcription factor domain-containing protein n=1 Tax=Thelonectria olida TaxID=1576542 RepID=A0A9P8WDT2_9HYPO|nr:fungal-specific transcription factor domain-containing protein [Thelonectria olida]
MLSNPLQRFSPYQNISSAALAPDGHGTQAQMQSNGLETLTQGSQYPVHHLAQPAIVPSAHIPRAVPQVKHRQHPYAIHARTSGGSGPIRRRISRACDQCNQLRTKCDGQHPCAHCIEFGLGCEYIRERKKRGKASRKELAQQAAAAAAAAGAQDGQQTDSSGVEGSHTKEDRSETIPRHNSSQRPSIPGRHQNLGETPMNNRGDEDIRQDDTMETLDQLGEMNEQAHLAGPSALIGESLDNSAGIDLNGFDTVPHNYEAQGLDDPGLGHQAYTNGRGSISGYPDLPYGMPVQSPPNFPTNPGFRMGNTPLGYHMGSGASPGWGISMASPPAQFQPHVAQPNFNNGKLRYPVLEPLVPHLNNIIPVSIACDLVDLYFQSSSSAQMHPMSPYVLGFVLRKRSFLHPTKPRHCQPALLASMLWVAAQTSDAPFLASTPSARAKTCQKLLELTVYLLRPLIHTTSNDAPSPVADGVALGGLGVAMPGSISLDALTGESGPFGAAGCLDDVITYIHLAVVVSASEYKGASVRWWNAAWSLARELKLGRELPPGPAPVSHDRNTLDNEGNDEHDLHRNSVGFVTEEEREERRRIWWLVYIVDRHLALCYNRPLFLLDVECEGLFQPMDDNVWQSGDFGHFPPPNTDPNLLNTVPEDFQGDNLRPRGPQYECHSHSIFGYFLPLMTILGEIVDLHHAKNHPRFGLSFRLAHEWDAQTAEMSRHLETYEQSLKTFERKFSRRAAEDNAEASLEKTDGNGVINDARTPSVHSVHSTGSNRLTESDIQTRIVIAYGTHVMHVLHILLAGKWDPINLLDDEDLWISSQGFITATSHAVAAAEAINQILEFDPGLEFMPFFFGIYLLQGSFLLLLIADKLQSEASPSVAKACETIVRAHEACVVTLNTEYQRKFSKVMRSALAQVRGRVPEDLGEQQQRRRELLALYRWTGDGTGLAL